MFLFILKLSPRCFEKFSELKEFFLSFFIIYTRRCLFAEKANAD
jgi:hypothetical protein